MKNKKMEEILLKLFIEKVENFFWVVLSLTDWLFLFLRNNENCDVWIDCCIDCWFCCTRTRHKTSFWRNVHPKWRRRRKKDSSRGGNSGTCGNLSWVFNDETSTLTISGQGVMSCCNSSYTPWSQFSEQTQNIEIKGGVSSIYQRAFFNFTSLKTVNITSNITSIGYGAFSICKNLISITIPSSVTLIG